MMNENYSVKKRLLAVILSLMMIFQMMPTGALADVVSSDPASPANTWNVRFLNSDGDLILEKQVENETAIGDLPATIAKEDYIAYWAIGSQSGGEQGGWTPGETIDSGYIVKQDLNIVPKYVKVTHTVTFYTSADKTTVLTTKTVDVDTSYCLNDIPAVPAQSGSHGKWVYSGGDFDNNVVNSQDTEVWPEYDQTVFTVTFMVDGAKYEEDTYYTGDALTLPADPVVEGKEFKKWIDEGGNEVAAGTSVTRDMTITAEFKTNYLVSFVILDESGTVSERLSQYFRESGEAIGTMPQDPFVPGKVFVKWVVQGTDTEVDADTVVTGDMTVEGIFRSVEVYSITAKYYYLDDDGVPFIFNTDLNEVEKDELPYTITAPSSAQTDEEYVSGAPIYYPETPTITIKESDFNSDKDCIVEIKYVPFTAQFDFVYKLKDLTGDGYSEIERVHAYGVLGSYVTPTIKAYSYANLEIAEGASIEQATGQELVVKYTRKNYQLTYETNGGSYVGGATVAYGTDQAVSTTVPTREGYTFGGWYTDEELTQQAGSTVKIEKDTTLYAKWTGKTVKYTIIYMKEKYNNKTGTTEWVYDNSKQATATVGTKIYAGDSNLNPKAADNGYELSAEMNGNGRSAGQGEDTEVTIAADGSSVVKIYYKLIRYTLIFKINRNNGRITIGGKTYNGSNYKIENVVLGQDVSAYWPATSTEIYDLYNARYFDGWTGASGTYITKRYELIWSNVSGANRDHQMTFTGSWSQSSSDRDAQYWLQQPDGTYKKEDTYTQTGLNTDNLGAKDLDGYKKHSGIPTGYPRSGRYDDNNVSTGHSGKYTYRFYYDRYQYGIDYFYNGTKLKTISNIYFDADISGSTYNYVPARPADVDSDYTWGGWYADAKLAQKYVFNKMPAGTTPNAVALSLFAKWVAPNYTVTFVTDGGTPVPDAQTVSKYSRVDKPATNPTKTGYTFDGWYTTADGNELFDWNTQITTNTTVYAHWSKMMLSYTIHYVDETGKNVADDKTVTNPNFTEDQVITEQAIAVAGYRPTVSSQNLKLSKDNDKNVLTFVYSEKTHTTEYTVNYVLNPAEYSGEITVATQKVVLDVPGDTASVIETAKPVDYDLLKNHTELDGLEFFPENAEQTLTLTANKDTNVFYFYYSAYKSAKVTVNFVDMNGDPIVDPDINYLKVGKTFTLSRTPIAGWELNKAVVGTDYNGTAAGSDYKITGAVADSGLIFTLFYQKKLTITAVSRSKQYDGNVLILGDTLADQITYEGLKDGDSLTSVEFDYANADSNNPTGRLNAGIATVTPKNAVIKRGGNTVGSNYYKIRYISGTLEVTKINVTIRIEPDRWTGAIYNGTPYKAGFTNPSKGIADYLLISHDQYKNTYIDNIWNAVKSKATAGGAGLGYYGIEKTDAGDYPYSISVTPADLPSDSNYSVSLYVREGRLQILPVDVTITTGSAEKKYDGTALTKDEASITGLLDADSGVTVTATGTITEPGSTENTYTINWGSVNSDNYKITENLGTLTVSSATLIVTVKDISKAYTGNEQKGRAFVTEVTGTGSTITTDDYTVEGLAAGDKLKITYTPATGTNAGTYTNGFFAETYTITNGGVDTIDFYETKTFTPGKLTITEAEMIVTATPGSKVYDGQPLTGSATSVPEGATITYSVKNGETWGAYTSTAPSITNVGTLTYKARAELANYTTVESAEATLEITARPVTFTATSETKVYTGSTITINDLTVSSGDDEGLVDGHSHNVTFSASGLNVGEYPGTITSKGDVVILSGETNVTDNYDITVVNGKLTITPDTTEVTVTITGNSETKVYNTQEQSVTGFTTDVGIKTINVALAEGHKAEAKGTDVGEYEMKLTKDDFVVTSDNYSNIKVVVVDGKLTITPITEEYEIKVTGKSDTKVYNRQEQSVNGYTVSDYDATITFTGLAQDDEKATAKGTNVDTYTMTMSKDDFTAVSVNYTNIKITVVPGTLKITPITSEYEITVTGNSDKKVYNGEEQSVNGYTVSDYDATITLTGPAQDDEKATAKGTYVGTYTMTMSKGDFAAASDNYTNIIITVIPGTLTVTDGTAPGETPVPDDLVVTKTDGSDKTYQLGETVVWTITVKNIYNEEKSLTVTETEGMTIVGTVPATIGAGETVTITAQHVVTAEDVDAEHITNKVTVKIGDLEKKGTDTVDTGKIQIEITADSASKVYDGTALTNDGYKVTVGKVNDDNTISAITVTGTQTLVGSSENVPSEAKIVDADGKDVTDCYEITYKNGILEVTDGTAPGEEPVPDKLVVTKDDGSEEAYQMGDTVEWTITVKNIYDETKTLTVTEAEGMKIVGNVPKTLNAGQEITIKVQHVVTAADVAAKNIRNEVTVKIGDLEKKGEDTVDTEPIRLTITAATDTKVYDGTALTNAGYELSAGTLNKGDRIASVTVTGAQTEVGSSANVPSDAKIVDASGNDVTAGYEITYFNGMLIVTERPMFILTIRYWQDGRLISTVTRTEVSGTAYDVATPPLRGYTASEERIRGVLTANAEYDVVYTPAEYLLTIRYQYQNGGEAAATYTETLRYGEEYSVQSPVIAGFRTANQLVRGTMPERNVIITVIYTAEGQATVITIDDFETLLGVGLGGVNTGETIE